jgi:hypothetical protein
MGFGTAGATVANYGAAPASGVTGVDAFGAVGDGTTDDSAAIQAAADACDGVLRFTPGKTYLVGTGVMLDPAKVRIVEGNNARIKVTGDIDGLTVDGTHATTSAPGNVTDQSSDNEFNCTIRELRFDNDEGTVYVGTGLVLKEVMGVRVTGCEFQKLHDAVRLDTRIRNLQFYGNHIWDLSGYGIYLSPGLDFHQGFINSNQILFCDVCIYKAPSADVYNVQICSNNLEVNDNDAVGGTPTACIKFVQTSGGHSIAIVVDGNEIEDHGVATEPLVQFVGAAEDDNQQFTIVGNRFGNANSGCIQLSVLRNWTVSNNVAGNCEGYLLEVDSTAREFTFTGNQAWGDSATTGGMLYIHGGSLARCVIANNSGHVMRRDGAIKIDCTGSGRNIGDLIVSNNQMSHSGGNPAAPAGSYGIDIEADHIYGITFTGNSLKTFGADSLHPNGMRVSATGTFIQSIFKDNRVKDFASGVTKFDFPSASAGDIIVGDNISN